MKKKYLKMKKFGEEIKIKEEGEEEEEVEEEK